MRFKLCLMLALALLAICSTSAFAVTPLFSVTVEPGATPGVWNYTLFNHDTTGNVVLKYLDIDWADPMPPGYYTTTGTPATWVIDATQTFPSWVNNTGNTPGPGQSLSGFELTAPTYATDFTVTYDLLAVELSQQGSVTPVPEPSSMLALLGGVGTLGALIRRRMA